jgi:hypothetical protein
VNDDYDDASLGTSTHFGGDIPLHRWRTGPTTGVFGFHLD